MGVPRLRDALRRTPLSDQNHVDFFPHMGEFHAWVCARAGYWETIRPRDGSIAHFPVRVPTQ
jgi:hypothetical protein